MKKKVTPYGQTVSLAAGGPTRASACTRTLRAFFLEGRPSHEVARDFGYSAGSFRVLCHAFRRDPDRPKTARC